MARVLELTAWWAVLVGVWLVGAGTFAVTELVVGALVAAACAPVARAARLAYGGRWSLAGHRGRRLLRYPAQLLRATARLAGVAPWRWRAVRTEHAVGPDPTERALVELTISATPGQVVCGAPRRGVRARELVACR